ncbi:DUF2076 domain-containing protein [Alsobacter sp. SYSU BS001988]|jgi:uncharacterized protein
MSPEERQLLTNLFERIKGAANTPRDKEAEAFITDAVRQQPYAPYLLSQTVIVQEEALKAAASRIQELEAQVAEREQGSTSFLGGLGKSIFGGGEPGRAQPGRTPSGVPSWGPGAQQAAPAQPAPGPWGQAQPQYQPQQGQGGGGMFGGGQPQGGGFLRSAMTTAAGVAGGALLFQGVSSLFNSHHGASGLFGGQGATDPASLAGGAGGLSNDALFGPAGDPTSVSSAAAFDDNVDDGGGFVDDASFDDSGSDDGDSWA